MTKQIFQLIGADVPFLHVECAPVLIFVPRPRICHLSFLLEFEDLRAAICSDEAEMKRLRQIIVNSVLATDFADEKLVTLRKEQWEKAFGSASDDMDLKATITITLLLQAADAFHVIQHWQVYKKWNERHFFEVYAAFEEGRVQQDPSIYWYKSELLFFEEHVIPLCKQMQELDVFGTLGLADEYLAFATENKDQWSTSGAALVRSMLNKYHGKEEKKSREDKIAQRQSLSAAF